MDGWTYGQTTHRWKDGWKDEWKDEWKDGCTDKQMDGLRYQLLKWMDCVVSCC